MREGDNVGKGRKVLISDKEGEGHGMALKQDIVYNTP